MRKVRSGQTFRPPPAADVNATGAAVDLLARKGQNVDGVRVGKFDQDLIVLVPAGGIAARDDDTIVSVWCKIVVEIESGEGEKTLTDTDDEVEVYNIYPDAVTELVRVPTSVTLWGTRYVTGEPC